MSNIEWTEKTWNPVTGCTRASAGCDNCYAVTMTHRLAGMGQTEKYGGLTVLNNKGDRHCNGVIKCHEDVLSIPLKRKKPTMWFVNSMSDLFHKDVPFEFIDKVFAVMALCPHHTFQILTKRPERMAEYLNDAKPSDPTDPTNPSPYTRFHAMYETAVFAGLSSKHPSPRMGGWGAIEWPLPNVWLGTTVENQEAADKRIPHLLRCPAAVRFLSCEPLIAPVDLLNVAMPRRHGGLPHYVNALQGVDYSIDPPTHTASAPRINWVIVGGESGKGARPCDVDWIRSIVQQCQAADVPCFVKQLGARPRIGYYDWLRWCETRGWDSMDAQIFAQGGYKWDIDRDGQPPRNSEVEFPNRKGDAKGGDMNEWPADLRVRQFPAGATP